MPIYEYQCPGCGAQKELFVKPGGEARPTCAPCRKRMRRVISQTAFILKGSGWYVTDYPSEARKRGLEGEKAPATSGETAPATKEAAPAEKPDKKTAPAAAARPAGQKKRHQKRP